MALSSKLSITWPEITNERSVPMLWLGAWLLGPDGEEGDWFHSGRGAAVTEHEVPFGVTGVRIRRWPNEGLAPEYADVIPVPQSELAAESVLFDRRQPFSALTGDEF